jgi:hypothetical protein
LIGLVFVFFPFFGSGFSAVMSQHGHGLASDGSYLGYYVTIRERLRGRDMGFSTYPVFECPTLGKKVVINKGILVGELVKEFEPGKRGTLYHVKVLPEDELREIEQDLSEHRITHLVTKEKVKADCERVLAREEEVDKEHETARDILSHI